MHSETRAADRAAQITMKTARSAPPPPMTGYVFRSSMAGTPLPSPKVLTPQPYQPRPSPAIVPRSPSTATAMTAVTVATASSQQEARSASPSYFGLVVDTSSDPRDPTGLSRDNWSPPTSSVKSFGAVLPGKPSTNSHDATTPTINTTSSTYDVFRRQADAAVSQIAISGFSWRPERDSPGLKSPDAESSHNHSHGHGYGHSYSHSFHDAADNAFPDFKRFSGGPLDAIAHSNVIRYNSVFRFMSAAATVATAGGALSASSPSPSFPSLSEPKPLRMRPPSALSGYAMSSTTAADARPDTIDPVELKDILDAGTSERPPSLLLIDLRAAAYYTSSRIHGALNLCIPTTLLKRPAFNLQKLQLTFQTDEQKAKFSAWRDAHHLVVYDSDTYEKRDAMTAVPMLRKFTSEGYKGRACILLGGFKAFEAAFPSLVDRQKTSFASAGSAVSLSLKPGAGSLHPPPLAVAPIIGGVVLPAASGQPSPFFANIRQNMDLADGVGRLDVVRPAGLDERILPFWLRQSTKPEDQGHQVSRKFLQIELNEQERMRIAYAQFNGPTCDGNGNSGNGDEKSIQICLSGIEKGVKNRYKDILPFDHARVRLQGRPDGVCDYVNASHIQARRSHKRYIASQGPLPATFEDFWTMVWDQDVRVLVNLTAESEGGQLKCHSYWTEREYGIIQLRLLSEKRVSLGSSRYQSRGEDNSSTGAPLGVAARLRANTVAAVGAVGGILGSSPSSNTVLAAGGSSLQTSESSFVVVRKFALGHTGHPFVPIREITQLHYSSWPDFGAPAQPSELLALVELANVMQRATTPSSTTTSTLSASTLLLEETSGGFFTPWNDDVETGSTQRPMLIHCSAGCGRTGTFCTVDSVIDMLKRQRRQAAGGESGHAVHGVEQTVDKGDVVMTDVAEMDVAADLTNSLQEPQGVSWLDDDSVDLVAATVEDFRQQRLSMVQSLRQFVLCYETIAEWVARAEEQQSGSGRGQRRARSGSLPFPTQR